MDFKNCIPTTQNTRINNLDVLRGVALLGILLMNIQAFSMPSTAYINPTSWGNFKGVEQLLWTLEHLLVDSKFRTIFAFLFGAGVCLFCERAEMKKVSVAKLHYTRNLWLIFFGFLHAHLIWYGDILLTYALSGLLIFLFRSKTSLQLIYWGLGFFSVASAYAFFVNFAFTNNLIPQPAINAIVNAWSPSAEYFIQEIQAYRGSFSDISIQRSKDALFLETEFLLRTGFWRTTGAMLIGMALYKNGILTGKKSTQFYIKLSMYSLSSGLMIVGYGLIENFSHGFSVEYSMFIGKQFNYWGTLLISLGYISLINLAIQKQLFQWLLKRCASLGQTAFSNYIFQSIVCTFIFYGYGLGQYAQLSRVNQLLIVLLIWLLQLIISPIWLKYFKFGPLEWVWRSLTYWQKQPMLRSSKKLLVSSSS